MTWFGVSFQVFPELLFFFFLSNHSCFSRVEITVAGSNLHYSYLVHEFCHLLRVQICCLQRQNLRSCMSYFCKGRNCFVTAQHHRIVILKRSNPLSSRITYSTLHSTASRGREIAMPQAFIR